MDILRIALASFKFGTKVGNKAVEVATRQRLPCDDKRWAKIAIKTAGFTRRTDGATLSNWLRSAARTAAANAAQKSTTQVWPTEVNLSASIKALCDEAAKGNIVTMGFLVPWELVGRPKYDEAFLGFREMLQRQNMDAILVFEKVEARRNGVGCFPCSLTVIWNPNAQYDP
jgi:hypothetical protein